MCIFLRQSNTITQSELAISIYIFYTLHTHHRIKHQMNWFYRTTLTPSKLLKNTLEEPASRNTLLSQNVKTTSFMDETILTSVAR
jgi:hypothetical protein